MIFTIFQLTLFIVFVQSLNTYNSYNSHGNNAYDDGRSNFIAGYLSGDYRTAADMQIDNFCNRCYQQCLAYNPVATTKCSCVTGDCTCTCDGAAMSEMDLSRGRGSGQTYGYGAAAGYYNNCNIVTSSKIILILPILTLCQYVTQH